MTGVTPDKAKIEKAGYVGRVTFSESVPKVFCDEQYNLEKWPNSIVEAR